MSYTLRRVSTLCNALHDSAVSGAGCSTSHSGRSAVPHNFKAVRNCGNLQSRPTEHATAVGGQNGHMNASAPRACIALGADAAVEVVEDFGPALGGGATFTNAVLEVCLAMASRLSGNMRRFRHSKGFTCITASLGG